MAFAVAGTNPVVSVLAGGRNTHLADAGDVFVARTPTPGTGIIGTSTVNAFTETTPVLVLYNGGSKNIYPLEWRIHTTVVSADATPVSDMYTFTLDVGNRYTSGGTALLINNSNQVANPNDKSGAFIIVGGITATAATGLRRVIGHVQTKFVSIEIVHDTHVFSWGPTDASHSHSVASNTTTPCYTAAELPPCVIGPNQSLVVVRWTATGSTAPTLEHQFSYVER